MIPRSCRESSWRRQRRWTGGCLAALVFARTLCAAAEPTTPANADPAAPSGARADELFAAGRAAMSEGRLDEACSAFQESERVERAAGTLVNWGVCLEAQGNLASAWRVYRESLELARSQPDETRERFARERLALLEPLVCRVRVVANASNPPGTVMTLDATELDPAAAAVPIPLDPGVHTLEVAAPGRQAWIGHFTSSNEDCADVVQVPELAPVPAAVVPAPDRPVAATEQRTQAPPRAAHGAVARRVGLTLSAGLFSGGLVGTAYFGLHARAAWSERETHCPAHRCDAVAVVRGNEAARAARAADVSAVVAVAALGAGIYFALSPRASSGAERARVEIRSGPHGGQVSWSTVF